MQCSFYSCLSVMPPFHLHSAGQQTSMTTSTGGRARISVGRGIKLDKERWTCMVLDRSIHGAAESQRIFLTQSQISGSKHEQGLFAVLRGTRGMTSLTA